MVRLTKDALVRGTTMYNRKRVDETTSQFLKRVTHLHLQDCHLDEIGLELNRFLFYCLFIS